MASGGNRRGNSPSTRAEPRKTRSQSSVLSERSLTLDDKEKATEVLDEPESQDNDAWPIEYHYLTFETQLPLPVSNALPTPDHALPPDPPNLKRLISPFEWPSRRKAPILWLSCVGTAFTAYTAGSCTFPFRNHYIK